MDGRFDTRPKKITKIRISSKKKNQLQQRYYHAHIYPVTRDSLLVLPYKQLAYYTELDEEGHVIFLDYDLTQALLCKIHKTQLTLDIEKFPICKKCVNTSSEI